jgi:glucoamylase
VSEALSGWLERQLHHSAAGMQRSISAVSVTKIRAGFGQRITPKAGSVVASPVLGAYDPDPDYFFHWFRDSALVMDALRLLRLHDTYDANVLTEQFTQFLRFSLELSSFDGRSLAHSRALRSSVDAQFQQFLRSEAELAAVHGNSIGADTRVNPDGSLDISRWARPQFDGPPLRALCVLRWLRDVDLPENTLRDAHALLRQDLAFTRQRWAQPCFDIWEEELGLHYYTQRVSAAAMAEGAHWLFDMNDAAAVEYQRAAHQALARLDDYWSEPLGFLRSRRLSSGQISAKELDIAVVLAAVHAGGRGAHTAGDARVLATLGKLEALFAGEYAINHNRPAERGIAMGRYRGDVYFSGGAYYFSTLGASELCYQAAALSDNSRDWIARGDAFLEMVRAHTPVSGDLSEQFDQTTGVPRSAQQLAWSYAAVISSAAARKRAIRRNA